MSEDNRESVCSDSIPDDHSKIENNEKNARNNESLMVSKRQEKETLCNVENQESILNPIQVNILNDNYNIELPSIEVKQSYISKIMSKQIIIESDVDGSILKDNQVMSITEDVYKHDQVPLENISENTIKKTDVLKSCLNSAEFSKTDEHQTDHQSEKIEEARTENILNRELVSHLSKENKSKSYIEECDVNDTEHYLFQFIEDFNGNTAEINRITSMLTHSKSFPIAINSKLLDEEVTNSTSCMLSANIEISNTLSNVKESIDKEYTDKNQLHGNFF
jgi:hypothetical protein